MKLRYRALALAAAAALAGQAMAVGGEAKKWIVMEFRGAVAALLIHDQDDGTVPIGASEAARDRYLAENGCDATTTPYDPAPCVQYDGCDAGLPVVWCQTRGQDHSRQDGLAAPAFWGFLSSLP